jgi:hypothetical protein
MPRRCAVTVVSSQGQAGASATVVGPASIGFVGVGTGVRVTVEVVTAVDGAAGESEDVQPATPIDVASVRAETTSRRTRSR